MMVALIVIAPLAGGRARYGALVDADTRTILGICGPLAPHEQPLVLAGRRPFDPDRAAWARAQHWGPALALALAPPALLAAPRAAAVPDPLAKTAADPPAGIASAMCAAATPAAWPARTGQRTVPTGMPSGAKTAACALAMWAPSGHWRPGSHCHDAQWCAAPRFLLGTLAPFYATGAAATGDRAMSATHARTRCAALPLSACVRPPRPTRRTLARHAMMVEVGSDLSAAPGPLLSAEASAAR
jgi:hypothetical protein